MHESTHSLEGLALKAAAKGPGYGDGKTSVIRNVSYHEIKKIRWWYQHFLLTVSLTVGFS